MTLQKNNDMIEGYDARYNDTTFDKCAEFCKTRENCSGFGYDKINKICYPSQIPVGGKPLESLFKDEYLYSNATCNKVKVIDMADPKPPFDKRRANSIYVCTESYDKQPQYYLHNKGTFKNIGEGRNIDDIFDIEEYPVKPYNWPRNRFDFDQTDLLIKKLENETYNTNNITDLNRIIKPEPVIVKREKRILPPRMNIKPVLDFNLQRAIDKTYDYVEGAAYKVMPLKINDGKRSVHALTVQEPEAIKSVKYDVTNNFNTGEYVCTKEIPLDDCVKNCTDDKLCKGVEWNPHYKKNNNVCCQYKSIGTFTSRNNDTKSGIFFRKLE